MSDSEQLRETIVSMQREIHMLRTETQHSSTLLDALDALLIVSGDDDHFTGVFNALLPVFDASHAIVLAQSGEHVELLECVASNEPSLAGSLWRPDARLAKVLGGRIVSTLDSHDLESCLASGTITLSENQPALYLPLGQGGRRGLLILLRQAEKSGFDRTHMVLAGKFSLLASHALAARNAHRSEVESQRLKQLTNQLTESQRALAFRANHDQLTGLPNRSYIQELVNGRLFGKEGGEKLALAFIDLDDFKRVNDVYGHAAGDALLCGVAQRIRSKIRTTDILGRISGDEFVVILDPFVNRREITALVRRINQILHEPFDIEGVQIKGTGSIGIALYPTHGRNYEELRRNADAAMYHAKVSSKGGVAFFNQRLGRAMAHRLKLENRLRDAFERKMFKCALQGKVDIHSGRIIGFETLLRWVDDRSHVHGPGSFLDVAGELGLLDGIALMQLDELIPNLPELDKRFGREIIYSFNISADQASRPAFVRAIANRLAGTGRAKNFTIELTEESFIRADAFQTQVLPHLRSAGIGISIDDFGTGYSSLSMLADITADEIKIDRSFITSIQDRPHQQSILRAVESIGNALGIRIVAEGIETRKELDYLRRHTGITAGQGFFFHRPVFIERLLNEVCSIGSALHGYPKAG